MRDMTVKRALARDWQLTDGARTVIAGYISARDKTLTAPFSGDKCIGYQYKIIHHADHPNMKTTKWTDFEGFALVPSLIRGSMRTVNVLARPHEDLSAEVPVRKMHADEEWARAESYLQSTDFGEKAAGRIANTRTRRIESGPGDFREDKQDGEPSRKLLDSQPSDGSRSIQKGERRLTEAIIREADRVILAGVYDAARQGIAPDPDDITRPYRLVVSGETSLKHKVHNRMIGIIVAGTLAIVSAGV